MERPGIVKKNSISLTRRRYLRLLSLAVTGRLTFADPVEVNRLLRLKKRILEELGKGRS